MTVFEPFSFQYQEDGIELGEVKRWLKMLGVEEFNLKERVLCSQPRARVVSKLSRF